MSKSTGCRNEPSTSENDTMTMKMRFLFAALTLALAAGSCSREPRTELFNGRDLAGWVCVTDPEGVEDKHFLDSLLFASQPEVAGKMVDVGAGAGFPGIVTKIFKPELELTLMEPTGKRVEFLKYACGQLGLTGVEFAKERAEEAARKAWREQFDLASARAVAALPMLAEYCLPLVKVGGNFLAMKGASGEEELAAARGAIKKLGGEYKETRTLHLPGGDTRTLILCKKISQTPTAYPRNGGKIAKSPLK